MPISAVEIVKMYQEMLKIRLVSERIVSLYPEQEMHCPVHLSIGQEASAVGVCSNLKKTDAVFSNHRCHAHYLAMGGDVGEMLAELYGKIGGCSRGNGGSMHLSSPQNGFIASSSIVGGSIPIAVGAALSFKIRGLPNVAVAFFGDGAVAEGVFHESLNFASLHNLPIVFVCENNFYAVLSKVEARHKNLDIFSKAFAYKMTGVRVDGNDVEKVYETAKEAVERARKGEGPTLIEAQTYRWLGHVGPENDYGIGHRSAEEVREWMLRCPIKKIEEKMFANKIISEIEKENMVNILNAEITEAVAFARNSPYPTEDDLLKNVYAV